MLSDRVREGAKLLRYGRSFVARKLVHTNLQLLYRCNFRCTICDYWKPQHGPRPELSLRQVEVISDKLATIGPQIISIGGGEPLLHADIVPIVRTLARDHFPVMICNGWFITPEIARALFAAGMYEISVSVDYMDPGRHDAQRGTPGAHARALQALRTLMDARTRPHQRVHMISVIMDDNLDDVEPLIRLCRRMGITYLVTLYSDHRGRKSPLGVPAAVSERLLELKARYPEFVALRGYLARFGAAAVQGGVLPCYAGRNLCNVDSQGDVSLCIDTLDRTVGNLLGDDPADIEARLLRVHEGNSCSGCWTSCRGSIETLMYGGDRVANLLDYRSMTAPVPLRADGPR